MARLGVLLGLCMLAQLYSVNSQQPRGGFVETVAGLVGDALTNGHLNTNIHGNYDASLGLLTARGEGRVESGLKGQLFGHKKGYIFGETQNEAGLGNILKLQSKGNAYATGEGSFNKGYDINGQFGGGMFPNI